MSCVMSSVSHVCQKPVFISKYVINVNKTIKQRKLINHNKRSQFASYKEEIKIMFQNNITMIC